MKPSPGSHPDARQANDIVFASCLPEFPNATLLHIIGELFPSPGERTILISRIVQHSQTAGFEISVDKVPCGDTDTLGAVSASIVANAAAPAVRGVG
jgi:hypothetical protein